MRYTSHTLLFVFVIVCEFEVRLKIYFDKRNTTKTPTNKNKNNVM